ncbi:hypothetical protein RIF29_03303 [Crotalaria pallida]|uniref:Uncharacterized protein n=1 Tax=Crotalaria pallida TaxID=3830 RepID=A0AAN9J291_CROPI
MDYLPPGEFLASIHARLNYRPIFTSWQPKFSVHKKSCRPQPSPEPPSENRLCGTCHGIRPSPHHVSAPHVELFLLEIYSRLLDVSPSSSSPPAIPT